MNPPSSLVDTAAGEAQRPAVRIVSSHSDAEIEAGFILREISWDLRELTANLMRVTRGAGKPDQIGPQCAKVVELLVQYRVSKGCYPSAYDLQAILDLDVTLTPEQVERHRRDGFSRAERQIVRGSLQVAASSLLGQRAQESRGEDEIQQGIRAREAALDAERAKVHRRNGGRARGRTTLG